MSGYSTALLVGTIAIAIGGVCLLVDVVPPRSLTFGHMHMMKRRFLRYAAGNDSLPKGLKELPHIQGYANEVTDGWGQPILWKIDGDEVTLTSFGRDGKPGGTGEDADIVG